jgi:hypothetical protein
MTDSISLADLPAVDDQTRRDRYGRYLVVPPQGGAPVGYSRATTIAKVLDGGGGLMDWKATMTVTGLLLRPGLRAQWEALMAQEKGDPWYHSQQGKANCKRLVEDCATVGGASDRAQIGIALHKITALVDSGKEPHLTADTARDVAAYQEGLVANGITLVPGAIELTVALDTYQVAGTFDRLVRVPGRELPLVADLKTGANLDYSWQSFAVQLAIYSRAEAIYEQGPAQDGSLDQRHPMPAVDQEFGLVLWLNAGSANLEVYEVDLNAGWEAFTHSMWTRGWRNKKVSYTFMPGPTSLESQLAASLQVVATAQSRQGGLLDCGHTARAGESIFKVDNGDRGGTTPNGNGLGGWVCLPCAHGQPAPEVDEAVARHPSNPVEALAGRAATAWPIEAAQAAGLAPQTVDYQPDVFAAIRLRAWLQERIDKIGQHPQARTALGQVWPPDLPTLKSSPDHTGDQLLAVEKLLDDVEGRYELKFPPPRPDGLTEDQATTKVVAMFPGSTVTDQPKEPA